MDDDFENQIDFETILDTCDQQDETLKSSLKKLNLNVDQFYEDNSNYKALKESFNEKCKVLADCHYQLMKNVQKVDLVGASVVPLLNEIGSLQEDITKLSLELEGISHSISDEISRMEERLQKLYSQFDEQSIAQVLEEVNHHFGSAQERESDLKKEYNRILEQNKSTAYEVPDLSKIVEPINENQVKQNAETLKNIEKNIAFLINEYNKNLAMLENYVD